MKGLEGKYGSVRQPNSILPHPVPLDLWDPFGFTKNMSEEKKAQKLRISSHMSKYCRSPPCIPCPISSSARKYGPLQGPPSPQFKYCQSPPGARRAAARERKA